MNTVFYYYLNLFQVLKIFLNYRICSPDFFYFNSSQISVFLVRILRLEKKVQRLDFIFSDIKDKNGQHCYPEVYEKNLLQLCPSIINDVVQKDGFVQTIMKLFTQEHILLYLRKVIEQQLADTVILLHVIQWHQRKMQNDGGEPLVFFIPSSPFVKHIQRFALEEFHIMVLPIFSVRTFLHQWHALMKSIGKVFALSFRSLTLKGIRSSFYRRERRRSKRVPLLAISYTGVGITFEETERCEFPWLLKSSLPYEQILVCFRRDDVSVTNEQLHKLSERGIRYLSLVSSKKMSQLMDVHAPSMQAMARLLRYFFTACATLLREVFLLRCPPLFYLNGVINFILSYNSASDLYRTHNIKITVDYDIYNPSRIAEQLALSDVGGVSIGYQLSHWSFGGNFLGTCADSFFLFGPYYRPVFFKSMPHVPSLLYSGYVTDYVFAAAKIRAGGLREKLQAKGADFIISYFDENSSDGRMSIIPHSRSALIYRGLLELVLADKSLGLICGPKRPTTLFQRLPEIQELATLAEATGRCSFFGGRHRTSHYPTESIQASDITITLLLGGTVGLESMLSGARTVFLDLEGLHSYPEYQWGGNLLVFDAFDTLIEAVQGYRNKQVSFLTLGSRDLVPILHEKDPFQDGKAAERIGNYLQWLLEKFNEKVKPEDALAYANMRYAQIWGKENMVSLSSHHYD